MPPYLPIESLIARLRESWQDFNVSATPKQIEGLIELVAAPLPEELLRLYRDHNGSSDLPMTGSHMLAARLMPIEEVIDTDSVLSSFYSDRPQLGRTLWLWSDDNSNYAGLYTNGPLAGWVAVLDHEEPDLSPAFRSVGRFVQRLIESSPKCADDKTAAFSLPSVPTEMPLTEDDPEFVDNDKRLADEFFERYGTVPDADERRTYAFVALRLLPVANTKDAVPLLDDPDMWVPERAAELIMLRQFADAVPQLARLVELGKPNGDSAAMRALVNLKDNRARSEIARLMKVLTGRKREALAMWVQHRSNPW